MSEVGFVLASGVEKRSRRLAAIHNLKVGDASDLEAVFSLPGLDTLKGARRLLSMRMKYLAYEAPHRLRLSELWRFVNASDGQLQAAFADMRGSPREDVAGTAASMLSVMLEAPKQFEAYRSDCIEALAPFSPGSSLDRATSENTVDLAAMKERPTTVYLCVPSSKIGVAAPWLAPSSGSRSLSSSPHPVR
ncbi:hypothetical protein [Brevundimonas diminuta]|uniref:hypothetical protein n=1 Tax=Brevundimonas diminuta TaxID=293 RepID=UPI003D031E6C